MIDPRDIKINIDANSDKAVSEVNDLIRVLGKATMDAAKLQMELNKLFRVQEASQIKTVRAALGGLASGGLDAQIINSATQSVRNQARASAASTMLAQEKAVGRALRDQEVIMERFTKRYDKLLELRKQINNLEAEARRGNDRAIAQQKELRAQAEATIQAVTQNLPRDRRQGLQDTLTRVLNDPTFNGAVNGRNNSSVATSRAALGRTFYNNITGQKLAAAETKAIISRSDAAEAETRAAAERKATATAEQIAAVEQRRERKQLQDAERAMYKRLMTQYKRQDARAVMDQQNEAEMDRVHNERMAAIRGSFDRQMRGRFGEAAPVFDSTLFDDEHRYRKQAELDRRRERDEAALRREADTENRRRDADQAAAERRRQAELRRQAALVDAPRNQALGGLDRSEAFGGAGLFAVQGNLLRNYAMMGATVGSVGFLASYVVDLEKSLAQLQAISTATDGEMRKLETTIINLGRASKFSAQELADAATVMAQAGLSVRQIEQALPAVTNLAVGTGTDLATTVDTITSTMTVFNLQTSEATDVANTLTAAMNLSKLSIDKYALGLQYSGNIADTVGIRYNELAAVLGGMADAGVRSGSTLGTGFRQLLLDLQTPTEKAKDTFKRLGLSMSELDIESRGLFAVLRELKDAGFTTADATQAFEVRSVAAFKAIMNNLGGIEQLNEQMLLTSAATDAAAIQMDTLAAKGNQFASGFGGAFYKATENVRESLKGVLDLMIMLTSAMQALAPVLQPLITLGIAFFTVWSIGKIVGLIQGLADIANAQKAKAAAAKAAAVALAAETAAQNANTTAQTANTAATVRATVAQRAQTAATVAQTVAARALSTVWAAMGTVTGALTIALTAASIVFGQLQANAQKAQKALDDARESVNNAKADFDETTETIDALSESINSLVNRSSSLRENSQDMSSEILLLQQRFAEYGLELNNTSDNIDTVIPKMIELRRVMMDLAGSQAQITVGNLAIEREAILRLAQQDLQKNTEFSPIQRLAYTSQGLFGKSTFEGEDRAIEIFKKYYNTAKMGSTTDLAGLDLKNVYQDLAVLSRVRSSAQLVLDAERAKGAGANKIEMDRISAWLKNFDEAMAMMTAVQDLAIQLEQNTQQRNVALRAGKMQQLEAMADDLGIVSLSQKGKSQFQDGRRKIDQRVADEGIGVDVSAAEFRRLEVQLQPIANMLNVAVERLLLDLVEKGLAENRKEAEAMLREASFFDDYQYTTKIGARESQTALTEEAPTQVAAAKAQGQNAASRMNRAVRQGVLGQKVIQAYPTAATTDQMRAAIESDPNLRQQLGPEYINQVKPLSLEDALAEIMAAETERVAAMRREFEYNFPGVFETTEDGSPKLPRRLEEYTDAVGKIYEEAEAARATLLRYMGLDDSQGGSGGTAIDEEIKLLESQKSRLEAQMSTLSSSVDTKSSPGVIDEAVAAYETYLSEYQRVIDRLYDLKWDDMEERGFKDPANAQAIKQDFLDNKSTEFSEKGRKGLDQLLKTRDQASDRLTMLLAETIFESAEARLKALVEGGGPLNSEEALRERIRQSNELLDEMYEQGLIAFDNKPDNRQRPEDEEVKRARQQVGADIMTRRVDAGLSLINKRFADTTSAASLNTLLAQSSRNMLDNSTNASSTGEIQRFMEDQRVRDAYRAELKTRVGAAGERVNNLTQQQLVSDNLALTLPEGSPERNAAFANSVIIAQQLKQATDELTQATAEYNAEVGQAANGNFWDMATASLEQFVYQQGILKTASETIADGLGNVFATMQESVTTALYGIVTATKDTGDAWRELGQSILKSILDLALKVLTNYIIIQGLKLIASMLPGGGFSQGFADAFAAAGFGNVKVAGGKALGGKVTGGVPGRDSVLTPLMPGEIVMRKSAVDMIGEQTLLDANATGKLAQSTVVQMQERRREPDMVNVYVVSPDRQPSVGPKDVVVAVMDDVRENGPLKKMIKQVAMGR